MNRLGWSRIVDQGVVFNSSGQPQDNWSQEELEHNCSYWNNQLGHYLQGRRDQQKPLNTNTDVGLGPTKPISSANINRQAMQEEIPLPFHRETPPYRPHSGQPPNDHNGGSGGGGGGGGNGSDGNGGGSPHPSSTVGDTSRHSRRNSSSGPPNRGPYNGGPLNRGPSGRGPLQNDPPGGGPPNDPPPDEPYYGDNDDASSEGDGWQAIPQQYYGNDSVNGNQRETGPDEN